MTIVNYDTPSYNTDFPISSWQPVPRLLAAACRHLARRFFLTQPAAPAKKQQPTCLGNRLQSVQALLTDLGLTKTQRNFNTENGHILKKIFLATEYALFSAFCKLLKVRILKRIDKIRTAFCA